MTPEPRPFFVPHLFRLPIYLGLFGGYMVAEGAAEEEFQNRVNILRPLRPLRIFAVRFAVEVFIDVLLPAFDRWILPHVVR